MFINIYSLQRLLHEDDRLELIFCCLDCTLQSQLILMVGLMHMLQCYTFFENHPTHPFYIGRPKTAVFLVIEWASNTVLHANYNLWAVFNEDNDFNVRFAVSLLGPAARYRFLRIRNRVNPPQVCFMDSNNWNHSTGVGEREGRILLDLVRRRHFG